MAGVAVSSCAPTKLLTATTDWSAMATSSTADLDAAPALVTEMCRLRAELEFLTKRVEPGNASTTFEAFYADQAFPIALPGAPTMTWKQQCQGYRLVDDTFVHAVASIHGYALALGGFASESLSSTDDLKSIVKSTSDGAARLSGTLVPYKSALEGVGAPLSDVANAVASRWKAHELRDLVDKTDAPLQQAIRSLEAFIQAVRDNQLRDLEEAAPILLLEMSIRDANGQKLDLLSGAMLDVAITDRVAQFKHQLDAVDDLLHKLAAAHARLRRGWDEGEDLGLDTVKAIGVFAKDAYDDVKKFQTPGRAP